MDMELDPEIAAQMGFSSFGGMPKKRKFDADDAFTNVQQDAPTAQIPHRSGANDIPIASVKAQSRSAQDSVASESLSPPMDGERSPSILQTPPDSAHDSITLADGSTMSLQALRFGVTNERGDKAYFLPSFLEDPWEKLLVKKNP